MMMVQAVAVNVGLSRAIQRGIEQVMTELLRLIRLISSHVIYRDVIHPSGTLTKHPTMEMLVCLVLMIT